jgi:hypothetical protein
MAKKKKTKREDPDYELNQMLDKMSQSGMRKTRAWLSIWQDALLYFFGEQLRDKRRHKNWDWIIVNYIWPSAIQEIAKLSKNHPKIITYPWSDDDTDVAEVWRSNLQWAWQKGLNKSGMRLEQIAAILDGKIFGYRVSKIYWQNKIEWDEEALEWKGDVKHRLWHPAHFWASDDEKIEDGNCGTERYVTLDWAIKQWPQFETELTLEAEEFSAEKGKGVDGIRGSYSTGTTAAIAAGAFPGGTEKEIKGIFSHLMTLVQSSDQTAGKGTPQDQKIVKLEEIYFKDYSTIDETLEEEVSKEELIALGKIQLVNNEYIDTETQKPIPLSEWPKRTLKKFKRPKFPKGRMVMRVGKTILNPKEEEQVWHYSRWPFVVVPHYLLPHMWQGINAVELYKQPQDMINISLSHLVNNMKMFGDPKVAVENDAIAINPKTKKHFKIGSGAGTVIRLVRGGLQRFKILQPPTPSGSASQLYQIFAQEFKNLTGLQAIARGERQGRTTATEAQHLALSSHDRIHLQSVYEDEWIIGLMNLVAEIEQRMYSIDRFIRIVGEDQLVGIKQITEGMKKVRFDVDILPGTTLPFDEDKRTEKHLKAYELMSDPNPNPLLPELLRDLEIPNWNKKLKEHSIWQKWTQFQQLYIAATQGEITPQQFVQILSQRALQEFAKSQQGIEGAMRKNEASSEETTEKDRHEMMMAEEQLKFEREKAAADFRIKERQLQIQARDKNKPEKKKGAK